MPLTNKELLLHLGRRTRETVIRYRHTFEKDSVSRETLAWIVESCGLFKTITTDEQKAAHNWGIYLLENLGVTQGLNYRKLVDAMLNLTIPNEALDREGE